MQAIREQSPALHLLSRHARSWRASVRMRRRATCVWQELGASAGTRESAANFLVVFVMLLSFLSCASRRGFRGPVRCSDARREAAVDGVAIALAESIAAALESTAD